VIWRPLAPNSFQSVQLIDLLAGYGYMSAAKAVMGFLGVDVGPARLPHTPLTTDNKKRLQLDLEKLASLIGFECHPTAFDSPMLSMRS